jgi:NAD-dependent DNA ligase
VHNNIPIVTEAFVAHLLDHGAVPSSMISEFAWAPPESGYGFIFAGRPKQKTRKEWIEELGSRGWSVALTLTSEVTHLVLCENGAGTALHNAAHSKAEVAVVTEDFLVHFVETGEELQSAFVAAEDSEEDSRRWPDC